MKTVMLADCICPIWGATERGDPDYIGSATLLVFGHKHFLVTSAHVLDFADRTTLYVPTPGELLPLVGRGQITRPPAGTNRSADKNDSSFLLLDTVLADELRKLFFFLPPAFLDATDRYSPTTHYTFCGYPETRSDVIYGQKRIKMQRYTYTSISVPPPTYDVLGVANHSHIAINYDTSAVRDERGQHTNPVLPYGISGGPIFRGYWRDRTKTAADVKLVGICMENREDKKALVGVRLNGVYEAIRSLHPDISDAVPQDPELEIVVNTEAS